MVVAVVEIGTRSIRMLVTESSAASGLRVLETASSQSPLNEPARIASSTPVDPRVPKLGATIERMLSTADKHGAAVKFVFGTASLRNLSADALAAARELMPGLAVLSSEAEARACHASACLVAKTAGLRVPVLISGDIGSGSFELTGGQMVSPGVSDWSIGTDLGSNRLRQLYMEGGLKAVEQAVAAALGDGLALRRDEDALVAFSGSAPTKFGWLLFKAGQVNTDGLRYDMSKVQGQVFSTDDMARDLKMLDDARRQNRDRAAQIVSPEDPQGIELEVLIAGMQAMGVALRGLGQRRFMVNAYGARHGIAWLLFQGRSVESMID